MIQFDPVFFTSPYELQKKIKTHFYNKLGVQNDK